MRSPGWRLLITFVIAVVMLVHTGVLSPVDAAAPRVRIGDLADTVFAIEPSRLLDTRSGATRTTVDGAFLGKGRQDARSILELDVAGRGNVPGRATAVFLNVTAVRPAADGHLRVFPCGKPLPQVASLNYGADDVVANGVFVSTGRDGKVCVYTHASTDLTIDVTGFVPGWSGPLLENPVRLLETRSGPGRSTVDDDDLGQGPVDAGSVLELVVAGRGSIPANADAAYLNIAAIRPVERGHIRVFPCGTDIPRAASLSFEAGDVVANNVFAKLGDGGKVCVFTTATSDFTVDVNGVVPSDADIRPVVPARLLDTRADGATIDGASGQIGRLRSGSVTELRVGARWTVPSDASAVFVNVTVIRADQPGHLRLFPCGGNIPRTASLNYDAGQVIANGALVAVGVGLTICIYTHATVDVTVDVTGFVESTDSVPRDGCTITDEWVPTLASQAECDALVALFDELNGHLWTNRDGWRTPSDPCTWWGVECGPTGITALRLFNNGLTGAVPADVEGLTNLTLLHLGTNQITALPPEIGNLDALTELLAFNNQLMALPLQIGELSQLRLLTLSSNHLETLPAEIGGLTELTELMLGGNDISELPSQIGHLSNLRRLGLSSNHLSVLPPEIGLLSSLEELNVYSNDLTGLPSTIGEMASLVTLDAEENQISSLPLTIGNLSRLQSLDLRLNAIGALPDQIGDLSSLTTLDLSANSIDALPRTIGGLGQLQQLELSWNGLTTLPAEIGDLTDLELLSLAYNQLSSLPSELGNLSQLTTLSLSINPLGEIPPQVFELTSLEQLRVTSTQLGSLPSDIGRLPRLTHLSVGANGLTSLPPELFGLTNLTYLDIQNNLLPDLPPTIGQLTQLEWLSASKNLFTEMPVQLFDLTALTGLDVSDNAVTELPPQLGNLIGLDFLDISGNRMSGDVTTAFTPLMIVDAIEYLYIASNRCLTTTDPAVALWLTAHDDRWNVYCV